MVEMEYDHVRPVDDGEHACEAVLRAVDVVSERSLLDLPPLQEFVDVDALNLLFSSPPTADALRFRYADYDVLVEPTRVHVRRPEPRDLV